MKALIKLLKYVRISLYSKIYLHKCIYKGHGCSIYPPSYISGGEGISFGENVVIGRGGRIETFKSSRNPNQSPMIIIGDNVNINWYCHIAAINKIEIHENTLIGSYVLITDHSHGDRTDIKISPLIRDLVSKGPIIIERNCWIGEKCSILPGVTIGRNSIIGANSVVTHDIPPYSIAAGVPAKVIFTNNLDK